MLEVWPTVVFEQFHEPFLVFGQLPAGLAADQR
jgi:hypothetical protein